MPRQDAPLGVPLQPTQIYASVAEFAIFVLLLWLLRRPHHDGEIMGAWLFLAGMANFFLAFCAATAGAPCSLAACLPSASRLPRRWCLGWMALAAPARQALQAPHAG